MNGKAWLTSTNEYEVDNTPYFNTRLSIFDTYRDTCREVRPFTYNYDHLKVHKNGAAIYSEEKKLAFLLPLIVEAHRFLPDEPIFSENDNSTLSLYRTSMWMHADTIKWLAETRAQYPPILRPQIQPRIDAIRNWRQGRRQPPTPPQPNRWQERKSEKGANLAADDPAASRPLPVQLSPRKMVADDEMYMDLQQKFYEIASTPPRAAQAAQPELARRPPVRNHPNRLNQTHRKVWLR